MLKGLKFLGRNWVRIPNSSYTYIRKGTLEASTKRIYEGILNRERQYLSKAITLIESTHPHTYGQSQLLLDLLVKTSSCHNEEKHPEDSSITVDKKMRIPKTLRIAITGPPGAGKSCFIEAFGEYVIENSALNVAVLTVDPSSPISGGSVLGDKTLMQKLAANPKAYVRPSPSGGNLGGVTRTTDEVIMLCEAAGYNLVLVETVGVGQSEYSVSNMVDLVMLLVSPAAGDELQVNQILLMSLIQCDDFVKAIKRGIMEIANIIAVTKYDGDLMAEVEKSAAQYKLALNLMHSTIPNWKTQVHMVSSFSKHGIPNLWESVELFWETFGKKTNFLQERRTQQRCQWFQYHIDDAIRHYFLNNPKVKEHMKTLEKQVIDQVVTPGRASDILVSMFVNNLK